MADAAFPGKGSKAPVFRARNLVAEALKAQGLEYVFGVVGYPVQELGDAVQKAGLKYFGMRNEQSASYAAAAVGYLTGRPGVVLTVTGPGVIHAVAGMANAKENCWPMLSIGGASESSQDGQGSFQEARQLNYVNEACKYSQRVYTPDAIPRLVEQAARFAMAGRPGAAHLDLPADMLRERVDRAAVTHPAPARGQAMTAAAPGAVADAVALLRAARAPLLIVGKGAAFARAEAELLSFAELTNIPFLPTPMGKGCLPDDHPQCVAPCRSNALKGADVVFLFGCRLNWMLHFGLPPRYRPDVKFVKVDVVDEEMDNGAPAAVRLVGHAKGIAAQLCAAVAAAPLTVPSDGAWWAALRQKRDENAKVSADLASDRGSPLNYYCALTAIQAAMPRDAVVMSEGANTMDIGRTILQNYLPRHRLDAGTFGTMGVGLGQVIAACAVHPEKKVVAVMGDSAFGFSMAEYETIVRFRFNALLIIFNNDGIGGGPPQEVWERKGWAKDTAGALKSPVNSLSPTSNYHLLADVFGGRGWHIRSADELDAALPDAMRHVGPAIMHVRINPKANRKKQEFPFGSLQSMVSTTKPKAKGKL